MARKHSAATKRKISNSLKKFYQSGGKRGFRKLEKQQKTKRRVARDLTKNSLRKMMLENRRKILMLQRQAATKKSTQIRNQIKTLQTYNKALRHKIRGVK